MQSKPSALDFVTKTGLPVLPLVPGSKRAKGRWSLTTDQTYTDNGVTRHGARTAAPPPTLTHYGVYLGAEYLVIDLDVKRNKAGVENWDLIRDFELPGDVEFPRTYTVRTPSGGLHYYYRTPLPLRGVTDGFQDILKNWTDNPLGVDVKTGTAYVVGPGSYVEDPEFSGYYEVIDDIPVAVLSLPAAAWLEQHLGRPASAPPADLADPYGAISEATRHIPNDTLNYDTWIEVGHAIHGAAQGSLDGLDLWAEWSAKCPGGASYKQCEAKWDGFRPRSLGADYLYTLAARNGFRAPEIAETLLSDTDFESELAQAEAQIQAAKKPKSKLQLIDPFEDVLETEVQLIDDILPAFDPKGGTVGLLIGASRAGKSTLVSHLAVSLATGRPFLGKEVNGEWGTLILAAEDTRGHVNRVKATCKMYFDGEAKNPWPIVQYPMAGERKPVREFLAWAMEIVTEAKALFAGMGYPLGLIVLDTFSAGMQISDENDNKEMADVAAVWRALSIKAGCIVMPVHHTGKAQNAGSRGASALPANADFHLTADADINERDGSVTNRMLSLTKTRDGETGPIAPYEIGSALVGRNAATGKAITAGYIIEKSFDERRADKARAKPQSDDAAMLHAILNDLRGDQDEVAAGAVVEAFLAGFGTDKQDRRKGRRRFSSALNEMMTRGEVRAFAGGEEITDISREVTDIKAGLLSRNKPEMLTLIKISPG